MKWQPTLIFLSGKFHGRRSLAGYSPSWHKESDMTQHACMRARTSFSSVVQLCPTLCNPMDCSMPGFRIHHQLPELTQIHIPQVSDAIQTSHPLLSPSPPAFNLGQPQGFFLCVSFSHQVATILEFQLQHQPFQ